MSTVRFRSVVLIDFALLLGRMPSQGRRPEPRPRRDHPPLRPAPGHDGRSRQPRRAAPGTGGPAGVSERIQRGRREAIAGKATMVAFEHGKGSVVLDRIPGPA